MKPPSSVISAVVPVAGLGTRLLPATRSQPKEMLPIVDRPVVQYVVEELVRGGISRVLFVTGRRKRAIEDHFDASPELGAGPLIDPRTGLSLYYTRQATPGGLGDAVRHGAGFDAGSGVVVALGDALIEGPGDLSVPLVGRLIEAYGAGDVAAAIAVETVADADVSRYGIVVGEERGGVLEVSEVVEKPAVHAVRSRRAVAARYVLGPEVFAALRDVAPDRTGEVQLADAFNRVLSDGGRIVAVPLAAGEHRHDIGSVQGYASVFLRYALRDPRFGAELRAQAAALLDEGLEPVVTELRTGGGSAPARAALAGNPSDGYGGAVLAVAIERFGATARATFGDGSAEAGDGHDLVEATIRRFDRLGVSPMMGRSSVEVQSSIPRLVGLAGSSAVVIATLRALYELHGVRPPESAELAELALSIEVEDLGIAAGLQDRVAQAFGGLVFMEFGGSSPAYEPLDRSLLPPLLVAWRPESAAHSGIVHGDLRARFERGDRVVRASMVDLSSAARAAREALLGGDHRALCRAVDASFDARARMMALDPVHVEMVTCARAAGAAANYAGSGGAVVCVCADGRHRLRVEREMRTSGVLVLEL